MTYTKTWTENKAFPYEHFNKTSLTASSSGLRKYDSSRTGVKVPEWKAKIQAGQAASSPYLLEAIRVVSQESGSASLTATIPGNPGAGTQAQSLRGWVSQPSSTISHNAVSQGNAEAIALAKTYSKVRQEYERLNSPAVIAEFLDVLRQFGSPARAIIDLTNRRLNKLELARKGLSGSVQFKRIKYHEIVASTHLEYAFGLAPLISDTKALAEAFAQFDYEKTGEQKFRSRIVSRGIDVNTTLVHTPATIPAGSPSWFVCKSTTKVATQGRVQYVCGLNSSVRADFGSNDRLKQLCGFNPANWVPAIWEAVPWSWLVDYFTNVQQILTAATTLTTGVAWIVKTVSTATTVTHATMVDEGLTRQRITAQGWSGSGSGSGGSYQVQRMTLNRSIPESLGVPPLVVEHPFGDVKKIANMVAVLLARRPTSSALLLT